MASWSPQQRYTAPRWHAVALMFLLGSAVAFAANWYAFKGWLG